MAWEISCSLPKAPLEGRGGGGGGGGRCAAGERTAGAAGPRQHRSAAKREEDAPIPGGRALNHPQTPWISACQDGRPPLAESAVYTYKQAVYAAQEDFSDNTERSLPRAQTHPSSTKLGGCSLICVCPLGYSPIQRGFVPLFSQAPGMGQLREAHKTFAWFPAAPQTRQQTFVSPSLRLCRQAPNSRQQFLPIRPRCPDTEDLVRQASQQTASALSNPPPSNSKRYAN